MCSNGFNRGRAGSCSYDQGLPPSKILRQEQEIYTRKKDCHPLEGLDVEHLMVKVMLAKIRNYLKVSMITLCFEIEIILVILLTNMLKPGFLNIAAEGLVSLK